MASQLILSEPDKKLIHDAWESVVNEIKLNAPEQINPDGSIHMGIEDFTYEDFEENVVYQMNP